MGDSPVQCPNCKGHYTPEDESQEGCPECMERETHTIPMVRRPESFTWHEVLAKVLPMLKMDAPVARLRLTIRGYEQDGMGAIIIDTFGQPAESEKPAVQARIMDVAAYLRAASPEGWDILHD